MYKQINKVDEQVNRHKQWRDNYAHLYTYILHYFNPSLQKQ